MTWWLSENGGKGAVGKDEAIPYVPRYLSNLSAWCTYWTYFKHLALSLLPGVSTLGVWLGGVMQRNF